MRSLAALALLGAALLVSVGASVDRALSQPSPFPVKSKDGAEMVLVRAGRFISGMRREDLAPLLRRLSEPHVDFYSTELPRSVRTLEDFYIDRYEVMNERYDAFVRATKGARPSRYARASLFSRPRQPVVGVGWADAERYCQWAGKRLPTEFEWEKAARGSDGRLWPWGNEPDDGKYNGRTRENRAPLDVGSFREGDSPYGVADMAGNVWEMTSSPWPSAEQRSGHVIKGGSYLNTIADVRTMVRWAAQNEREGATWLGFRCASDRAPR